MKLILTFEISWSLVILVTIAVVMAACDAQVLYRPAGASNDCPTANNPIYPRCWWKSTTSMWNPSAGPRSDVPIPPPAGAGDDVRISSSAITDVELYAPTSEPFVDVAARYVYVGDSSSTTTNLNRLTLRRPYVLYVTKMIVQQGATVSSAYNAELKIEGSSALAVTENLDLTGLFTLDPNSYWDQAGAFNPGAGGGPNGGAQINAAKATLQFGSAQSWPDGTRFNITAASSVTFYINPSPYNVTIATSYFKLRDSSMNLQAGNALQLTSTGIIEATGNVDFRISGSATSVIAGKLNVTCNSPTGSVYITAPLIISSSGSFYQSACGVLFMEYVRVDGILIPGANAATINSVLVSSAGQFVCPAQIGSMTVDAGGKVTCSGTITGTLNIYGDIVVPGQLIVTNLNMGPAANLTGRFVVYGNFSAIGGQVNITKNSNFVLVSSVVFHVNIGVTQMVLGNFSGGFARIDISSTTSFPTTQGFKWTFLFAERIDSGFDGALITPPPGVLGTYSIVYERSDGIIKNVSLVLTLPPPALPPVALPVAPPVALPVAAPVATPIGTPVGTPVDTPVALLPPTDGTAPAGSAPVASPVAAPVAAPVAPPVRSVVLQVQLANATSFNESQIAALYQAIATSIMGVTLSDISITLSNGTTTITITVEIRGASVSLFDEAFSAANRNQTISTLNSNLAMIPGVSGVSGVQVLVPPVSPPTSTVPPTPSAASVSPSESQPVRASSAVHQGVAFGLATALLLVVSLVF